MGKPKLDFLFRDLTELGLPKSQFSIVNDERAYNYNPDRYNFYMQLLDDVADPDQKIASKVLGVLTRNRRQHERIQEKIDGIANAIHYLKNKYTKPAVIGEPRQYGELATLKDDLNNKLKRIPIVSKEYEIDTDFAKMETSDIEKQKIQGKVEELLQEDPTLKNEMRLNELENTLNEIDRKITALTPPPPNTTGTAGGGAMLGGTKEEEEKEKIKEEIRTRMISYKKELDNYRNKITEEPPKKPQTEQSKDKTDEGGLKSRNQFIRNKINEIRTQIKYLKDEKELAEQSKLLDTQKDNAKKLEVEIDNLEKVIDMLNKKIYADDVKIVDEILKMASKNAEGITKIAEETAKLQVEIDKKKTEVDKAIAEGKKADAKLIADIARLEEQLRSNNEAYEALDEKLQELITDLEISLGDLVEREIQTKRRVEYLTRQLVERTDDPVKKANLESELKVVNKELGDIQSKRDIFVKKSDQIATKLPTNLQQLWYNFRTRVLGIAPDNLDVPSVGVIIGTNIGYNNKIIIKDETKEPNVVYELTITENSGETDPKINLSGKDIDIVLHDDLSYFKERSSTNEIFVFVSDPLNNPPNNPPNNPHTPTTTASSTTPTSQSSTTSPASSAEASPAPPPPTAPSSTQKKGPEKSDQTHLFWIKPRGNDTITGSIYKVTTSQQVREYADNLFNPLDILKDIVNKPMSDSNRVGTFTIKRTETPPAPAASTDITNSPKSSTSASPSAGGGGRRRREGGSAEFVDMVEYMARQQGGSWFGEKAKEFQEIDEKRKAKILLDRKDVEAAEDDILLEYKNHPLYSPDNQEVTFTDRLVFVGITFVFRAISLFMVEWGINTKLIKSFNGCVMVYVVMYLLLFSIWVLLVNIRKNNLFFGMLFYYINSNYNVLVRKRIIIHMAIQLIMLVIPFAVVDPSIVGSSELDTFDKKERVMNTIGMFTLIIWFLTSFVALRA